MKIRSILLPLIPSFILLTLTTLGAGAVAADHDLKDSLAKIAALSGGGLAVTVAAMIAIEDDQWGGDHDGN